MKINEKGLSREEAAKLWKLISESGDPVDMVGCFMLIAYMSGCIHGAKLLSDETIAAWNEVAEKHRLGLTTN